MSKTSQFSATTSEGVEALHQWARGSVEYLDSWEKKHLTAKGREFLREQIRFAQPTDAGFGELAAKALAVGY